MLESSLFNSLQLQVKLLDIRSRDFVVDCFNTKSIIAYNDDFLIVEIYYLVGIFDDWGGVGSKKKLVLNDDAIVEEANRLGLDLAKYTTKGKLSIKRLYTAIEKLAKEDETIIMDNLAHIEQTGSVRRVSDSKPGYGLWEAVVSESEELLKSAVSQLTERQMSVLEHIKDIAKDQQDKIEVFHTLNTMVEKTGPLTLTVQDILSDVTVNEVSGNAAGKANPEQESIRDEQGNENSDTTASETESAAAIDPDEDFVVDFDDEYDEPAPIAGMSL